MLREHSKSLQIYKLSLCSPTIPRGFDCAGKPLESVVYSLNPSSRQNVVVKLVYERPSERPTVQTLGEGEGSSKATRRGRPSFLGGKLRDAALFVESYSLCKTT